MAVSISPDLRYPFRRNAGTRFTGPTVSGSRNIHCGIIYADYTTKTFEYENFTEDFLYKPFGNNENPGWDDLQLLLESRCVPKTRRDIDDILDFLGLKEYNPLEILKITKGELLSDKKKMEVIRLE